MAEPDTTTQAVQQAPYWFAAVLGVFGVVLGVFLKGLIDAISSRARNKREDRLRFVADKRQAYADLLTACQELADTEHAARQLVVRSRHLDRKQGSTDMDDDEWNKDLDANQTRRAAAYREVNRSAAIVDVVAPASVVEAASLLISRAHHPHLLPRRVEAQTSYIDAIRVDLGHLPIGRLPNYSYEPYIGVDDPESGVDLT